MVSEVLSELFPVIDVENIPGELLLLGGTRLCIGSQILAGAAGQVARIQVFNPVDSNQIISISSVVVGTLSTQTIRYAVVETLLTSVIDTQAFRDGRLPRTSRPTGLIRSQSSVAKTNANGQFRLLANTSYTLEDHNTVAVVPPGTGFEVGADLVASQITVTFNWRERSVERAELQF